TEELVEVALGELRRSRAGPGRPVVVVDLGTGSGAVGLSIAAEAPASDLAVWVTDVSGDALAVARANLDLLAAARPAAAARVRVAQGSWFAALPPALGGGVDLVVSNPPYVAEGEWADLDPEVRDHEPRGALVAGPTGTEALAAILTGALPWLGPGAGVVLELAPAQAGAAQDLARSLGYAEVTVRPDLAGRARVLVARTPSSSPPGP
ncbi:MAG TPA: HemK/PrmC family methyltransferase, partial [Acidimicrobiales bacterium]|nr:HemK/PrmC family methyltransferase [Acidimicrobiales bacterium]